MSDEVKRVADVPVPIDRAKAAIELIADYQNRVVELSRIRREAIDEASSGGMSQSDMAAVLGVSRGRIGQLASSGPPPERAFFGVGPMTVPLGGKHEAGKEQNASEVITREDLANFEHLRTLFESLKLESKYEVIPPTGIVNLNRDNLVVVCGPRLSPIIAQVLESDHHLRFQEDRAWHLVDVDSETEYRSPIDETGEPSDFGYLGRLPRLDGRGTFLYIAGIHSIGANGVVHYLERNLAQLYREVRTQRFSTVIACKYDPDTLDVLSSERVTPLYRHDG